MDKVPSLAIGGSWAPWQEIKEQLEDTSPFGFAGRYHDLVYQTTASKKALFAGFHGIPVET